MKNLSLIFLLLVASLTTIQAQAPQAVCYQALAKDASNNNILESTIGIRATIIKGSANGASQWIEVHTPMTDQFGLFTIEIGQGAPMPGGSLNAFQDIDWGNGEYWLRIEFDPNNTGNYQLMGASKIISVPYALYANGANRAETAETANHALTADVALNDQDTSPDNELQTLSFQNGQLSILDENGSPVGTPIALTTSTGGPLDDSNTNELQTLINQNGQLILQNPDGSTNGNGVNFDGSSTNELQTLSFQNGELAILDQNGNPVGTPIGLTTSTGGPLDDSNTNELQSLISQGGQLFLENPDGSTNGSGVTFDESDTNELQELSIDGNTISISGGNTIELSSTAIPFSAPGASYDLPQGLYGEYIVRTTGNYTVPNGKTFWITAGGPNVKLKGLGITPFAIHPTTPNMPVLPSGQVVQDCMCTGVLIDNSQFVQPLVINLIQDGSYTVPEGKTLFVKSGLKNDEIGYLKVNNSPMEFLRSNFTRGTRIIAFPAGTLVEPITSNANELILTGFLIDEEF